MSDKMEPVHPGVVLEIEFLEPMGISPQELAMAIRVPATRIHDLVHARRALTADTALRLARFLGTSPRFWMELQQSYDLDRAQDALGDDLAQIQPYDVARPDPPR